MSIATFKGLPVYEACIDANESLGLTCISLVDTPAVQSEFLAFADEPELQMFRSYDEEKRIIRGVAMKADFPIFRRNEKLGEFYLTYSADTIRKMASRMLSNGNHESFSVMHDGQIVEGVELHQLFIKDVKAGINPAGFDDCKDGSLFVELHITNDDVWDKVKSGLLKGFSLEGLFTIEPVEQQMSTIDKIKDVTVNVLEKMGCIATTEGVLEYDGDTLEEGDAVTVVDDEGNQQPVEDCVATDEMGRTITVEDGHVESIEEPEIAESQENTDDTSTEEADTPPSEDETTQPTQNEELSALKDELSQLNEAMAGFASTMESLSARMTELEGMMSTFKTELAAFQAKPAATDLHQAFTKVNQTSPLKAYKQMTAK